MYISKSWELLEREKCNDCNVSKNKEHSSNIGQSNYMGIIILIKK
jgi:hypothetical protein